MKEWLILKVTDNLLLLSTAESRPDAAQSSVFHDYTTYSQRPALCITRASQALSTAAVFKEGTPRLCGPCTFAAGLHCQVLSPRQQSSKEHNDLPQMTQNHSCSAPLLPRWPGSEDALLEAQSHGMGKVHSSQCTWSGSHGCTFKHIFSNPQNKPERITWKLLYSRAMNEKSSVKSWPLWRSCVIQLISYSHHPMSWAVPWSWTWVTLQWWSPLRHQEAVS